MSYVGVPAVPRDSTIASSMIVQDYIATHFRGEKPISRTRHKPKGVDSCFGNFPLQYKRPDQWDGNPTLRRDSRTSYTSPNRSPVKPRRQHQGPDVKEVSRVIRGVGARPATAGASRRFSRSGGSREPSEAGIRSSTTATLGARPKSASAARRSPSLQGRSHTQQEASGREERGVRSGFGPPGERSRERARPKTAGAALSSSRGRKAAKEDMPDMMELEATRAYLHKKGKFIISPSKLMASLEVARATNSRPLSAPACARRRRPPIPPKAGAWHRRPIPATLFRKYYVRGDLPICVDHRANGNAIRWKIRPADLDFHVYLPIFFDGVREIEDPYRFLAVQGTLDLIEGAPDKVLPVIPQLILPIKTALNTREPRIICPVLKVLQQMILLSPMAGQALVPYYRQLLPVFNLFRGKDNNVGDAIDYNQRSRTNIGELVMETLAVMEQFGGPDAFINIKYMIPTYESCGP